MSLFVSLLCAFTCLVAGAAVLVGLFRRIEFRKLWITLPGCLLTWGLRTASVGVEENVWPLLHPLPILFALLGCAGLWLTFRGCRAAISKRPRPTSCLNCGYNRQGLPRCPECGT